MNVELRNFLLSLTEQDAITAIDNARSEAAMTGRPLRATNAFRAYDQAREQLSDLAGIVSPLGLGAPALVWKKCFKEVTANPSLENVKFVYRATKARI